MRINNRLVYEILVRVNELPPGKFYPTEQGYGIDDFTPQEIDLHCYHLFAKGYAEGIPLENVNYTSSTRIAHLEYLTEEGQELMLRLKHEIDFLDRSSS